MPKSISLKALLAKLESTYGTAVALTETQDGQLLALSDRNQAIFNIGYLYDGSVGPAPGNLGMLPRTRKYGRAVTGTVPMRPKGFGTTYTATELPNVHTMLKVCGFDSTLSSGAMTYYPGADGFTQSSATMKLFDRGEAWTARGVRGSFGFDINGAGIPTWLFDVQGILSTSITDTAMVAPTYPTLSVVEPAAAGLDLTIASSGATWTVSQLRSASFRMNQEVAVRQDLTADDAHGGFVLGAYDPEFRITVESTALTSPTGTAGFSPYDMVEDAESVAIALAVNASTAFNRWGFDFGTAQLKEYNLGNDGPIATTELVFQAHNSTPVIQTNACVITFD